MRRAAAKKPKARDPWGKLLPKRATLRSISIRELPPPRWRYLPVEADPWAIWLMQLGMMRLEGGKEGNRIRIKKKQDRIELVEKLYYDFRTRNPRARAEAVQQHIIAELAKLNFKFKNDSDFTLVNRDLPALRKQGRIPKYHLIPFKPSK